MTDINLKTLTPDTSLPTTGFLFGADSQASTNPSVYSTQTVATTLLGSTSLTGDTLTADAPVLNLAQTWNSVGTTFTGMKFNAAGSSSTNSSATSLLMDLQIGGTSQFTVSKNGRIITNNGVFNSLSSGVLPTGNFVYFYAAGAVIATVTSSGFSIGGSNDVLLTRKAAANLQLGAADAVTPVAQTLSVQSVVAGTSNTAGAAFTITGSQGTGTGAGGSIVFQVAPAGGSGTAQNALAAALTIDSTKLATFAFAAAFPAGSTSNLAIQISATNYGLYRGAHGGGASIITNCAGTDVFAVGQNGGIGVANIGPYTFTTSIASSYDASLWRDAAGVLGVRGTSSSVGAALSFIEQTAPASPAANIVRIYAEDNGSGKTRLMAIFATGAAQQIAIEP